MPSRDALIDQMAYLLDEVEALRPALATVPAELLTTRPPDGSPTILERFGRMAHADAHVFSPALERRDPAPELVLDDAAAPADADAALDAVADARRALVDAFESIPQAEWEAEGDQVADVRRLALAVVHHDADALREIALMLHDGRPVRLPPRPQP